MFVYGKETLMDLRGCDVWLALQLQDRKTHLCDDIKEKAKKKRFLETGVKSGKKENRC
jgi:hypothetical protein